MTKPARFTQSDLERALKACEKVGARLARAKINTLGEIELTFGDAANDTAGNPLDRLFGQ